MVHCADRPAADRPTTNTHIRASDFSRSESRAIRLDLERSRLLARIDFRVPTLVRCNCQEFMRPAPADDQAAEGRPGRAELETPLSMPHHVIYFQLKRAVSFYVEKAIRILTEHSDAPKTRSEISYRNRNG